MLNLFQTSRCRLLVHNSGGYSLFINTLLLIRNSLQTYSLTQPTFSLMEHIKFVFNFTQRYSSFSFIDRKFKVHLQTKIGVIIISCFQLLCMLWGNFMDGNCDISFWSHKQITERRNNKKIITLRGVLVQPPLLQRVLQSSYQFPWLVSINSLVIKTILRIILFKDNHKQTTLCVCG